MTVPLTDALPTPTVGPTVERQRGFIPKRRTRVSYQKGSIDRKGIGKYLLRYRVRDANHPSGWRKASELIEAANDKAAERERDRRMRAINSTNETATKEEQTINRVPTFGEFSETLWMTYLKNKRVKESTMASYSSVLRYHLLLIFEKRRLDEITPAEVSVFFDELGRGSVRSSFSISTLSFG